MESGKGAIRAQLALIAYTLLWWAAALCEMTKCCVPGPPAPAPSTAAAAAPGQAAAVRGKREQASRTLNISTLVITFPSALSADLFLTSSLCLCCCSCSIFAWSNIAASPLRSQCVDFFTLLYSASLFFPHCLFHLLWLNAFQGSVSWMLFPFLAFFTLNSLLLVFFFSLILLAEDSVILLTRWFTQNLLRSSPWKLFGKGEILTFNKTLGRLHYCLSQSNHRSFQPIRSTFWSSWTRWEGW